jgi:cytochrome oxidase Cu insertion factor (SCO1/SenC/PrrC family)
MATKTANSALIVIPAVAGALLVWGGTIAAVVIIERKEKKPDQNAIIETAKQAKAQAGGPASVAKGNAAVGTEVGNLATEIEGEDIDGQRFKLSDYRGKVVVLDFWGNW